MISDVDSGICNPNEFTRFSTPSSETGPGCQEVVEQINQALEIDDTLLTSDRYYFLSELEPFLGEEYQKLPCFLRAIREENFDNATLIVDRMCTLSEPLILPSRFTLAGTGINGEGELRFIGLPEGASAIQLDGNSKRITIRDIAIGTSDGEENVGINVSGADQIFIRDTIVTGFFAGIFGSRPTTNAFSVYIDRCNIFENSYNIVIRYNANHWRIRDCVLNQATCWGIWVFGPDSRSSPSLLPEKVRSSFQGAVNQLRSNIDQIEAVPKANWGNDHLITGCRIEGCGRGGAHLGSHAAVLVANRFEQNGGVGGVGIRITSSATGTRLLANYLSANNVQDKAKDTESWGEIQ